MVHYSVNLSTIHQALKCVFQTIAQRNVCLQTDKKSLPGKANLPKYQSLSLLCNLNTVYLKNIRSPGRYLN